MFPKLLAVFILVPVVEFILFVTVGNRLGWPFTLLTIVVTGFVGAWLTKRQGLATLQKVQGSTQRGEMPADALIDGLMILIAGAVLLTPGFLTDAIGFAFLIPGFRSIAKRAVLAWAEKNVQIHTMGGGMPQPDHKGQTKRVPSRATRGYSSGESDVINVEAEVVDVPRD